MSVKNNLLNHLAKGRYWLAVFPLAILVAGCGGGTGQGKTAGTASVGTSLGTGSTTSANAGRVEATVRWPEGVPPTADAAGAGRSRYIPQQANSLYLELTNQETGVKYTLVITRRDSKPTTQTAVFDQWIPVGKYLLVCAARNDNSQGLGGGPTLAIGATEVTVEAGKTAKAALVLQYALKTLTLVPPTGTGQEGNIQVGNQVPLVVSGKNAAGEEIAPDELSYSLISGDGLATITEQFGYHYLEAKQQGVVRVRIASTRRPDVFVDSNPIAIYPNISIVPDYQQQGRSARYVLLGQPAPIQLRATQTGNTPDTGVPASYTWESLTPDVVQVSPDGIMTPVKTGRFQVRVTSAGGKLAPGLALPTTYTGLVQKLRSLDIDGLPEALSAGQMATLTASLNIDDGIPWGGSNTISWSIVDGGAYATVDAATGVVRALGTNEGQKTVRIRATHVETGTTAEANLVINSYGGVHVGVQ